jgi:molecular chaperone HscA
LKLSVSELQNTVAPLIGETLKSVHKALSDAELKPDQIDEVVLVGGSTRYPGVMQALMPIFPHVSINNRINPDEVVALGAAIEADVLAGNRSDVLLLDVTPLSLGIETAGGLMDVLIPRNSKIPTRLAREYTTSVDGQVNLKVSVFQGERELVGENRKLGEFILKGIPAMPAGLPKIQIQFALNPDGILKVAAKELRSGVEQEVEIQPTYGLTDSQVEEMLLAGFQNAQSDIELRLNQETINEGNQMVYTAERFIEKNGQYLSAEEIAGSKQRIEDLRCLLNDKADRNSINKQIELLNDYTRPFAERVMDIAIGQALKGKTLD